MPESLLSYSFENQAPSGLRGLLCSYLLQVPSYILLLQNLLQDTLNTDDVPVVLGLWSMFLYCLWIILLYSLIQKIVNKFSESFIQFIFFLISVLCSQTPFKFILFSPPTQLLYSSFKGKKNKSRPICVSIFSWVGGFLMQFGRYTR